jgi:L-alanine-DL-glutamate epimerase-like enolase superfamily enzyme
MQNRTADISLWVVGASKRTNWIFVKVTSDDGRHGWGEATLIGHERLVVAAVEGRRSELIGLAENRALALLAPQPHDPGGRASHAASSAIEQAMVDIEGKRAGQPVYRLPRYFNVSMKRRPITFNGYEPLEAVDQHGTAIAVFRYPPAEPHIRLNVRYGSGAEVPMTPSQCPRLGVKQT